MHNYTYHIKLNEEYRQLKKIKPDFPDEASGSGNTSRPFFLENQRISHGMIRAQDYCRIQTIERIFLIVWKNILLVFVCY